MRHATSAWLASRDRRVSYPGSIVGASPGRSSMKSIHLGVAAWVVSQWSRPLMALFHGHLLSAQSAIHAPACSITPGPRCVSIAALLYEEVTGLSRGLGRLEADSCNLCTGLAAVTQWRATTWIKAHAGRDTPLKGRGGLSL